MSSCIRTRRTRRVNNTESDEEDFQYEEGDLTTVESHDGLDLEFRVRVLSDLLVCPICRGFFKDAMTIKECLHTFCRSCIVLQIAQGLDSCPLCSSRIAARLEDSIQGDVTIQNLVDKLFPHFAKEEEIEKEKLYEFLGLSEDSSNSNVVTISRDREETSSRMSLTPSVANHFGWDGTDEWLAKIAIPGHFRIEKHHALQVSLQPDQQSSYPCFRTTLSGFQLPKPFIRTSPQIQVQRLAVYIASKLGLNPDQVNRIELLIEGQVLAHSHTLEFVCRSRRLNTRRCVPILFRLVTNQAS